MAPPIDEKPEAEKKTGSVDQIESMDGRSQEEKDVERFAKELDEKALLRKVSVPCERWVERADVRPRSTSA